ncbi:hypothetical protein D3C72_1193020 [compost metagenome]
MIRVYDFVLLLKILLLPVRGSLLWCFDECHRLQKLHPLIYGTGILYAKITDLCTTQGLQVTTYTQCLTKIIGQRPYISACTAMHSKVYLR